MVYWKLIDDTTDLQSILCDLQQVYTLSYFKDAKYVYVNLSVVVISGNCLLDLIKPSSLFEMVGHRSVIGPSSPLRECFETNTLHHMIIVGPSGSGKVRSFFLILLLQYKDSIDVYTLIEDF